jgi:hypothetical protein
MLSPLPPLSSWNEKCTHCFFSFLLHLIFGDKRSKNSLKEIKNNTFKKIYFHFASLSKNILESNLLKTFYCGCLLVLVQSLDLSCNFQQYPFIPSKVIQVFHLDRHTVRHTPFHPYMNGWKNFNALFDTFHFTTFASLTLFVKDKFLLWLLRSKYVKRWPFKNLFVYF